MEYEKQNLMVVRYTVQWFGRRTRNSTWSGRWFRVQFPAAAPSTSNLTCLCRSLWSSGSPHGCRV